jgi:hypothetical protein
MSPERHALNTGLTWKGPGNKAAGNKLTAHVTRLAIALFLFFVPEFRAPRPLTQAMYLLQ